VNEPGKASPFVWRYFDDLRRACEGAPLLDLACGRGRHAFPLARAGARVVALDRNREHLRELCAWARRDALPPGRLTPVCADAERHALPFRTASFGAVLVTRFLDRRRIPEWTSQLRPGGLFLLETYTLRQRDLGYGPRDPEHLLDPGELPKLLAGLEGLAYEEGLRADPRPEWVASYIARRPRAKR